MLGRPAAEFRTLHLRTRGASRPATPQSGLCGVDSQYLVTTCLNTPARPPDPRWDITRRLPWMRHLYREHRLALSKHLNQSDQSSRAATRSALNSRDRLQTRIVVCPLPPTHFGVALPSPGLASHSHLSDSARMRGALVREEPRTDHYPNNHLALHRVTVERLEKTRHLANGVTGRRRRV